MSRARMFINWAGLAFFVFLIVLVYLDAGIFAGVSGLLKGLTLVFYFIMAGRFIHDIAQAIQLDEEREADTKTPSENGKEPAEPFGKRDTSVYLIDKGRTNRW